MRISDSDSYWLWVNQRTGNQPAQSEPGVLLGKGTFTGRDLANEGARKTVINVPVPVGGELFKRFRHVIKKPQIVWMSLTIRINNKTSSLNIVRSDLKPFWDMRYFIDDTTGKVIIGVTPKRELRWATTDPPPWVSRPGNIKVEPKESKVEANPAI